MIVKFIILLQGIQVNRNSQSCIQQNQITKRYKIRIAFQTQIQILKSILSKQSLRFHCMEKSQYREVQEISRFLSNYSVSFINKIEYQSQDSIIVGSQYHSQNNYLIKHIPIVQQQCDLEDIIQTLSQHRDFDSKHILTLLDFQIVERQNKQEQKFIRTIYQYGRKSLQEQIQIRKNTQLYFQQDELWVLLSSLVNPLAYLQSKRVIYGVLAMSTIFVDPKIKLLDPSCTGINPYQISSQRHYSPQLLNNNNEDLYQSMNSATNHTINMFKSDVFVLGLIILQSGLLLNFTNLGNQQKFDMSDIQEYVLQFQQRYSDNLSDVLKRMLNFIPEHRPSFQQILDEINKMFEFSSCQIQVLNSLDKDKQDEPNQMEALQQGIEDESNDYLDDFYKQVQPMTEFQKAKQKFLGDSNYSHSRNASISQNDSAIDLNLQQKQKSSENQHFRTSKQIGNLSTHSSDKRRQKSKQIKDKLVKHYTCHPNQIVAQFPQFESSYKHQGQQNQIIDSSFFLSTQRQKCQKNEQKKAKTKSRSKTMMNCSDYDQNYYQKDYNYLNYFNGEKSLNSNNLNSFSRQNQNPDKLKGLFTDPELMKIIKSDLKKIQEKRSNVIINGKIISEDKENMQRNTINQTLQRYATSTNSNQVTSLKKSMQKNSKITSHNTSSQFRFESNRNQNSRGAIHYQQLFCFENSKQKKRNLI